MELDEQSHSEPKQVTAETVEEVKLNEKRSVDVIFDRFIKHTPNVSEDDPNLSKTHSRGKNAFSFEDRVCYTLRMQVYKQLRACIKLYRRAALLSDKVLPDYLYTQDIEEFKNTKILPHLYRAYQLHSHVFCHRQAASNKNSESRWATVQANTTRLGGLSKTMTPLIADSLNRVDETDQRSEMIGRKLNFFGGISAP